MVVFHIVLTVIELVITGMFLVLIFAKREALWNQIMRLILTTSLLIINVIQLPLEVIMEGLYGLTIAMIIVWLINVIISALIVGNEVEY